MSHRGLLAGAVVVGVGVGVGWALWRQASTRTSSDPSTAAARDASPRAQRDASRVDRGDASALPVQTADLPPPGRGRPSGRPVPRPSPESMRA